MKMEDADTTSAEAGIILFMAYLRKGGNIVPSPRVRHESKAICYLIRIIFRTETNLEACILSIYTPAGTGIPESSQPFQYTA